MRSSVRVLLAEDHIVVREGLKALLEKEGYRVVAEAADGRAAVRLASECACDIAVLDLGMPGLNGIDAAREILKMRNAPGVILLTVQVDEQYVLSALKAGIQGYVVKTQAASDLVQAIDAVHNGSTYLSPSSSKTVVEAFLGKRELDLDPLTARERQVLQLVAEGKSTKETAYVLGISVKTAESHRTRLMGKLDIHETAGLVRYAIRKGLVEA